MRNFISFGNAVEELDLAFDGSTLISGENIDADTKNGAGKTTILNAISYALYNKPIAQISKERLINRTNASKNTLMEVRLEFEVAGTIYEIYRCRGENYSITLTEDGKDVTPDSIAATDRKIVELIGISYELFCIVIVFSGPHQPFLSLPISTQRTLIEELFKITALSEKAVKLKEIIRGIETEINIQQALIKAQQLAAEQQVKRIKDAEERVIRWEGERESSIGPMQEKLASLKQVDFKGQQELFALCKTQKASYDNHKSEILKLEADLKRMLKKYAEIENEIAHLADDKCPYCLQGFAEAGKKLEDLKYNLIERQIDIDSQKNEILLWTNDMVELGKKNLELMEGLVYEDLSSLLRDQSSIMMLEEKLHSLIEGENPHVEAYEKLLLEDVIDPNYDQIDKLKSDVEHHQFLLKLLTDKNSFVRRRIINKTIPFLNTQINTYTTKLGLPHIVKFDSDMSCSVEEYGRALDFGNLSSGEQKRVNLALSLAFRDMLHHLHSKVNILLMDEVDAGLDANGVEAALGLIKRKCRDDGMSVWIISHRPEAEGRFDREIVIRKEHGFSSIIL